MQNLLADGRGGGEMEEDQWFNPGPATTLSPHDLIPAVQTHIAIAVAATATHGLDRANQDMLGFPSLVAPITEFLSFGTSIP